MAREWARTAQDVVWRRSKLGLRLTPEQVERIEAWMRTARANDMAATRADPPTAAVG